jgi:decaprenylphospho-beta-D-ribofuranose 2-oxidase
MSDSSPTAAVVPRTRLSGWGRLGALGTERFGEDLERLTRDVPLTRGLGRSYGDSSLPPPSEPIAAATPLADRIIAFDPATGVLRAEAGLSLRDLFLTFLPRGWFTPVSPGTQFVTLGGMVAADVHGKNHHRDGSIGRHVRSLTLRVASGAIVACSRDQEPELFRATIGGMGLTGHILEVELTLSRVSSPWILAEKVRVTNVDAFVTRLREARDVWPFTMGWIDCLSRGANLGRGALICGRWATAEEAPKKLPGVLPRPFVPFDCPEWVMGHTVGRVFNELFYRAHPKTPTRSIIHPERFFYPLDNLRDWNRLYGRRGFTQYQCVLPEVGGAAVTHELLERMARFGAASFLCVIKDCGEEGEGLLSFPMPGILVAVDLPIRDNTQQVVDGLNEFVIASGGRIYLAKDALTRAEHFRAMEPRLDAFLAVRRKWDPAGRIRSAQSIRLLGDRA